MFNKGEDITANFDYIDEKITECNAALEQFNKVKDDYDESKPNSNAFDKGQTYRSRLDVNLSITELIGELNAFCVYFSSVYDKVKDGLDKQTSDTIEFFSKENENIEEQNKKLLNQISLYKRLLQANITDFPAPAFFDNNTLDIANSIANNTADVTKNLYNTAYGEFDKSLSVSKSIMSEIEDRQKKLSKLTTDCYSVHAEIEKLKKISRDLEFSRVNAQQEYAQSLFVLNGNADGINKIYTAAKNMIISYPEQENVTEAQGVHAGKINKFHVNPQANEKMNLVAKKSEKRLSFDRLKVEPAQAFIIALTPPDCSCKKDVIFRLKRDLKFPVSFISVKKEELRECKCDMSIYLLQMQSTRTQTDTIDSTYLIFSWQLATQYFLHPFNHNSHHLFILSFLTSVSEIRISLSFLELRKSR